MGEWSYAHLDEFVPEERPICYGVLKPGSFDPDGVPLVRIVDMDGDAVDHSALFKINPALDRAFARSRLSGDEVLLSIQGTVGRVALATPRLRDANISRTVARIALDTDRYNSSFLRYWLRGDEGQRKLSDALVGTTRSSLNISALRRISVPVPPLEEQRRIAEVLDTIDDTIRAERASLDKKRFVREGLATDLLTGRVRTPPG